MTFPIAKPLVSSPATQRGLSLIEIMVALTIGAFLLFGLVQMFAASRAVYQMTEGTSRIQENGRFAMDVLQRDLRMAGHLGCTNDQARWLSGIGQMTLAYSTPGEYDSLPWPQQFHISLQGYEAQGTATGGTLTLSANPTVGGVWSPALPAELAARAIPGSDVIVLRYLTPDGVPVTSFPAAATNQPIIGFDSARWDVLRSGVEDPGLFGIADCTYATVFVGVRNGGQIKSNARGKDGFREIYEAGKAQLYRAESIAYYVGIGASGEPALFRYRVLNADGAVDVQEIVEGVENLQLVYGKSMESNGRPTGYVHEVQTADKLGAAAANAAAAKNWRLVGAIQVGLLTRSPDRAAASTRVVPYSVLGLDVAAPAGDTRVRAVYETSLALRNRLSGN